jgi:NCS1 family nucleobase:cation symporter-1
VILYILIPWSVINLLDYYVLRHGNYRTADFYEKNGSFGAINYKTMAVYLIAFAIEVPFMDTTIYEGPVAKALDGGDIAWIVGAVVTVPLYLLVMHGAQASPTASQARQKAAS